jgi:hypothetical protein
MSSSSSHSVTADPPIIVAETGDTPVIGDFTIRLKFLDDTERIVRTSLKTTVLDFKKFVYYSLLVISSGCFRTHFETQVASGKVIRLIFRGQLLRDDNKSLESYGLYDQCIVHCHINNR